MSDLKEIIKLLLEVIQLCRVRAEDIKVPSKVATLQVLDTRNAESL